VTYEGTFFIVKMHTNSITDGFLLHINHNFHTATEEYENSEHLIYPASQNRIGVEMHNFVITGF